MPYNILVTPKASQQMDEALEYYINWANKKVADNLLEEIFNAFKILKISPAFPVKTKNYRVFTLKQYPYILFFQILEETQTVKILALFHTSQNPEKYP